MLKSMIISFGLAVLMAGSAHALTASQSVLKEVKTKTETGEVTTELIATDRVTPGEVVVYRLDFMNDQEEAVTDLTLTMPVPEQMDYIEGSAERDNARVVFSVDGGTSFGNFSELTIAVDDIVSRPALTADITHIRWTLVDALEVEQIGELSFKARLK